MTLNHPAVAVAVTTLILAALTALVLAGMFGALVLLSISLVWLFCLVSHVIVELPWVSCA